MYLMDNNARFQKYTRLFFQMPLEIDVNILEGTHWQYDSRNQKVFVPFGWIILLLGMNPREILC